jgi:hypothetical protein
MLLSSREKYTMLYRNTYRAVEPAKRWGRKEWKGGVSSRHTYQAAERRCLLPEVMKDLHHHL